MLFNRDEINNSIKARFAELGYDTEQGSNIQQISQVMAYFISMLNTNTAINIKETLLSSATRRDMIIEDARLLGYEPKAKTSFTYKLKLKIKNISNSPKKFQLDKYSEFISNGKYFYYLGEPISYPTGNQYIASGAEATFEFSGESEPIVVKEGMLQLSYFDNGSAQSEIATDSPYYNPLLVHTVKQIQGFNGTEAQYKFDIPIKDVEQDGVFAIVEEIDPELNSSVSIRRRSQSFMMNSDDLVKTFIRQDLVNYGTPQIYFKYGKFGTPLNVGDKLYFNVLVSSGSKGNATGKIFITDTTTVDNSPAVDFTITKHDVNFNVSVEKITLVGSGSDEESDTSIIANAPIVNNSGNRLVTYGDYLAACSGEGWIKDATVWDGFDEFIKKKGQVYFSFANASQKRSFNLVESKWTLNNLTDLSNWYMDTDSGSSKIKLLFSRFKSYAIPTISFFYRQPTYMDFEFKVNVSQYNSAQSAEMLNNQIFTAINNYFNIEYTSTRGKKSSINGSQYNATNILDGRFNQKYDDVVGKKEQFSGYFHGSELVSYISENSTSGTSLNVELSTYVNINKQHIYDVNDLKIITFCLGIDYNKVIAANGTVIYDNIPKISATGWNGYDILMANNFEFIPGNMESAYVTKLFVKKGTIQRNVGLYRIIPDKSVVEIVIFAGAKTVSSLQNSPLIENVLEHDDQIVTGISTFLIGENNLEIGLYPQYQIGNVDVSNNPLYYAIESAIDATALYLNSDRRIQVTYPSQNISFYRNTIPRLRSVEIIR